MFSVNILKVVSMQTMLNCFWLVQNVTISFSCLSRASAVEKFGCTLKSRINFNSANLFSSILAFSKRIQICLTLFRNFEKRQLMLSIIQRQPLRCIYLFSPSDVHSRTLQNKCLQRSDKLRQDILTYRYLESVVYIVQSVKFTM